MFDPASFTDGTSNGVVLTEENAAAIDRLRTSNKKERKTESRIIILFTVVALIGLDIAGFSYENLFYYRNHVLISTIFKEQKIKK